MSETLYKLVAKDEGEGAPTQDISEEASDVMQANFGKQVLASVASKTGDQLTKPGLILTWLLTATGAPALTIGLLAPVREAGSLLPQMWFANFISRHPIKKHFWVLGSLLQGLSVSGIAFATLFLDGTALGWTVVGFLVVFSLSRAICSISSKDLLGKTIPKTRRGRLSGLASSISGWVAVAIGLFFAFNRSEEIPLLVFTILISAAAIFWFAGAWMMSRVIEFASPPDEGDKPLQSLSVLKEDKVFRRFCIARGLLASTVLSMPFYVVLAHESTGGRIKSLGLLMIAGSLATALSGFVWGKLSDSSSHKTLALAGLAAGLTGCLTAGISYVEMSEFLAAFVFAALFFLIGLAHTGIRIGRKTYLVDYSKPDNRAKLVAVSNTLMGLVLLLSGSFGLLAEALGAQAVILVFAILGIIGGLLALSLPETKQ